MLCFNICFNRQRLIKKVTPKYSDIKIQYTYPTANIAQKKIQIIRPPPHLKKKIKFLYVKINNMDPIL